MCSKITKPQNRTVLSWAPVVHDLRNQLCNQQFWVRSEKWTCWVCVADSPAERRHRFGGFSLFSCFPVISSSWSRVPVECSCSGLICLLCLVWFVSLSFFSLYLPFLFLFLAVKWFLEKLFVWIKLEFVLVQFFSICEALFCSCVSVGNGSLWVYRRFENWFLLWI